MSANNSKYKRVEIIEVSGVGNYAASIASGYSRSVHTRDAARGMAAEIRAAIVRELSVALDDARMEGRVPNDTGKGSARLSPRAFGTSLSSLRAHIVGDAYMAAHNESSTIYPRKTYLAIPIADGLRGDGTPKLNSPRAWKMHGSFTIKSKQGRIYIVRKANGTRELSFLYVLVESVTLRKYGEWAVRVMERAMPAIRAEVNSILASAISTDTVYAAYRAGLRSARK